MSLMKEIICTHSSSDELEAEETANALVDFCIEELGIDVEDDDELEEDL
jgi:hypothetical protein